MPTMKNYRGVIIEESLADKKVLGQVKITSTRVSVVTPKHATPWLKKWTLHTVEIEAKKAGEMARELSKSLDSSHSSWYADFHNEDDHPIIIQQKTKQFYIFKKKK